MGSDIDNSRQFKNDSITRIRVPKTSEIVADKFREQIVRGELREGDFLPPEGQLMSTLGISRPTIREAFRILETENLISVVRGSRSGARVHEPSIELVSRYSGYVLQFQKTTVADLYEARLAIEPHAVRLLASKPPKNGLVKLKSELERLRLLIDTDRFDDFTAGITIFHQALVEATENTTLSFLNRILLGMITRHQNDVIRRANQSPDSRRKGFNIGFKSYAKLVELIEAKKEKEAVAHWRLHLANASVSWVTKDEGNRIVDGLSNI